MAPTAPLSLRRALYRWLPRKLWQPLRNFSHGQAAPQRAVRAAQLRTARARHRAPSGMRSIDVAGRVMLGSPVDRFRTEDVRAQTLASLLDALDTTEVDHFLLGPLGHERPRVVVATPDRGGALEALAAELSGSGLYLARVAADGRAVSPRLVGAASGVPGGSVLRLFRVVVGPTGGPLSGEELGCDLEFWDEITTARPARSHLPSAPVGTLVPPRRNGWTDQIAPSERVLAVTEVTGQPRPVLAATLAPRLDTFTEPVDVVYTWVDGADPLWQQRRDRAMVAAGGHVGRSALAVNESRYTSRDELRFSLRSLHMYAGWVRRVFLLTDDQVPDWLDTSHPGLTVVSHREVFADRGRLPTFNSHAIESQLHHVEGLAEHFLYVNDDVFFGRPVTPGQFFAPSGIALFNESTGRIGLGPPDFADPPVMSAAKNNRDLVLEQFGVLLTGKLKHVPHALRRSVLHELEATFPEPHARTAQSQFRAHTDLSIVSSLAHWYGYATGRSMPGGLSYFYADIARDDTPVRLAELGRLRDRDVFCLNDHDSGQRSAEEQALILREFLEDYFPLASPFERDTVADLGPDRGTTRLAR